VEGLEFVEDSGERQLGEERGEDSDFHALQVTGFR
jgi:hypothetical protein